MSKPSKKPPAASALLSSSPPLAAVHAMSHSALESHAEAVARELLPDEPTEGERGIDFNTIITLVMTVVQTIVQNCPLPPSRVREAFRRPTLRQRAALLKACKENCDCCNMSRFTGQMHTAILVRAATLTDADAQAIIHETADDSNLLV
jgi:hypothetical protein